MRLSVSACVFRLEQRQQGAGDAAVLSPVFGFVEQVKEAQRSDRRLQPAAGGVEQIFAGCAAVQVEGGAAGMLVALRGASQGDEGGRGLCVKLQLPLPSAVTCPIGLPLPSVRVTVAPGSAVPLSVVPLLGLSTGAAGACESTVTLAPGLLLPAASWATTLTTVPLAIGVDGV